MIAGFEISDVLAINDKDYSITFGLYFSVEWMEPRLNLSKDLWSESNVLSEMELVPGFRSFISGIYFKVAFLSQFGIDTESVAAKYIYLQFEIIQNYRCSVKVGWTLD